MKKINYSLIFIIVLFQLGNVFAQKNLCVNPSFEKDLKDWTTTTKMSPTLFERSYLIKYDGKYSMHIKSNSIKSGVRSNTFVITRGKQYKFKIKVFVVSGIVLISNTSDRLSNFPKIVESKNEWVDIEINSTATKTRNEIINFTQYHSTEAEWYIDKVEIVEVINKNKDALLPHITIHPKHQYVTEGDSALFSLENNGKGPFKYQWLKNNITKVGSNKSFLLIESSEISHNGNHYKCIVTNSLGADTSKLAFHKVRKRNGIYKNQKWETILTSEYKYKNPYKDVTIKVHFYNSDNTIRYDSYGFWDGQSVFKIRTYFPNSGVWKWKTTCSNAKDKGLHNKSGSIIVNEYKGKNKIYKHGALKISTNKRFLIYADGTPFKWMGGTAWAMPMAATYSEWKTYIDDRASKKFNIIQVAPSKRHGTNSFKSYPKNRNGDTSFVADNKWNPAYWREFDKFIEYANLKGIVVVIVGLGEPVYDVPSEKNARLFARSLSARMDGYHVIMAPAFDIFQKEWYKHNDNVGGYISNSHNLVTQHPGTSSSASKNIFAAHFHDKDYLDFSLNQTGHNNGRIYQCYANAKKWNIELWNDKPTKPVINSEAYYSSGNYAGKFSDNVYNGTDENARALGWLSWLSGSMGYTYGATGVWNYGEKTNGEIFIPLKKAMTYKSSTHMKFMVEFFDSLDWWELQPRHTAIKSNLKDERKKMVLAIAKNGKFGAAYLPNNKSITIDMSKFSTRINASWFNPVTGVFTKADQNVKNKNKHTFKPPKVGEWALLLKNTKNLHKKTENPLSTVPIQFQLEQNYPNPFNPTTTIKYSIPSLETLHTTSQLVQLKVYNLLGKEVTTLINQQQAPGNHRVTFNANNLPSGTYFYRIRIGGFSSIKKMVLLK